jgi:hypothetical protein
MHNERTLEKKARYPVVAREGGTRGGLLSQQAQFGKLRRSPELNNKVAHEQYH